MTIYDHNLSVISYDEKDVNFNITDVTLIPKDNTIYIDYEFAFKKIDTLILLSKRLRFMYQIKETKLLQNSQFNELDENIVANWLHEFNPSKMQLNVTTTNQISPAELDRKAFSQHIFKVCFNVNIKYHIETGLKRGYDVYLDYIEIVEDQYLELFILLIYKKYNIRI